MPIARRSVRRRHRHEGRAVPMRVRPTIRRQAADERHSAGDKLPKTVGARKNRRETQGQPAIDASP